MKIKEIEHKLFLGNRLSSKELEPLKALTSVDVFSFKNPKQFIINDTYFDTRDLILAKNNSYFRLRTKNDDSFITLRICQEGTNSDNVMDEFTHPLDFNGLRMAMQKLRSYGFIEFIDFTIPDILMSIEKVGLYEVVNIFNERTEKEIWHDDSRIGRIKFDYYYYKPLQEIHFAEIETDIYDELFIFGIKNLHGILQKRITFDTTRTDISKYQRGIQNRLFSSRVFLS